MTIRHLKIFIAVAQTGSMSQAARELYLAQPTVSQVISEIEQHYGSRMFERLSRKLYITDTGRRLLDYARHIVALFDEMEVNLQYASSHVALKVGATITVGSCMLPELIQRFERNHPSVRADVYVDNTQVIEEKILGSDLDLALVEGEVRSPDLVVRPVVRDDLVLVCGAGHPLAGRERVSVSELEGMDFVLREQGSGTRRSLEQYLRQSQVRIHEKWVCHSTDSILNAVARDQGLTVISRRLVEPGAAEKKLHILQLDDVQLTRTFSLIYHKNKFLSPPIQMFLEELGALDQSGS